MAANPVPVLAVIIIVLVFEAMIGGEELVQESFPDFDEGSFGGIDILGDIITGIFGTVAYIFNLITFNVGGAPWFIRVPVGTVLGGALIWSITTLIRGN